jgi:hypothetical protein
MEKKFINKNTDIKTLTQHICNFLEGKDFEIMKGESENGYQIFAANSPHYRTRQVLNITIEGKPNNFTIKLEPAEKKKRKLTRSIWLMQMLGGGFLLAEQWKSEEAWTKLEKEFWNYTDNSMQHLADPVKSR